jgi:hypothetical protein
MQLTGKQQKFLEAYLANGRNGAAAYRAAYQTNASNQRAAEEASRLLRHPKIAPKIDKAERRAHRAVERVLDRYVVSEERVTEALAKIGFYDIRDLFSWTEDRLTLKASGEISDAASFAIREICQLVTENGRSTIRIKLADRCAALMALARLRGMIGDRSTSSGFHAELERMPPEEQHRRVAELLEFAASLKVPPTIDMEPTEEE